MSKIKNLSKQQIELILGDIVHSLGYDVRVTLEFFDGEYKKFVLAGAKFKEDEKTIS